MINSNFYFFHNEAQFWDKAYIIRGSCRQNADVIRQYIFWNIVP